MTFYSWCRISTIQGLGGAYCAVRPAQVADADFAIAADNSSVGIFGTAVAQAD